MATEDDSDVPESGAVFTFGKSKFAENEPNKFWIRKDRVIQIACGDEHSALVAESGRIFTFGANDWGQLGLGHTNPATKPSCVKSLKQEKVRKVCCGRCTTFVATESGRIYGFGANGDCQMGSGGAGPSAIHPVRVEGLPETNYISLAAGSEHTAALTDEGELYMWGGGSEGQLGLGDDITETETPKKLDVGEAITCVACGYYHTAIATESGKMYTFGEKDAGKLGLGEHVGEHTTPQEVKGINGKVKVVACGGSHSLAITEEGRVYVFGEGQYGQMGHGTILLEKPEPQIITSLQETSIKFGFCGENHTALVTEKGKVYTFGDGSHGKLGLGIENFSNQFRPSLLHRFDKLVVEQVACGGCHMLVMAHPRLTESVGDSDNDDVTPHNGGPPHLATPHFLDQLRNSDDLNLSGSFSARNRRREKIEPAASTLNRTLPPLTSNLSASQRSLPALNAQNSATTNPLNRSMLPPVKHKEIEENLSNLKDDKIEDDDDKESGVSSDGEDQKPTPVSVDVTTEATVHSPPPPVSSPVPKPRQSPAITATTANSTAASPASQREDDESEETESEESEDEEDSVPEQVTKSKPVPVARRPVPRKPLSDDDDDDDDDDEDESDETDKEESRKKQQDLKHQLMSSKVRNGKLTPASKKENEEEEESEEDEDDEDEEEEMAKKKDRDKKKVKGRKAKSIVKKKSGKVKSLNKKNKENQKHHKKVKEESEEDGEDTDDNEEVKKGLKKKKTKEKVKKENTDEEEIKKKEEDEEDDSEESEEEVEEEKKNKPEPKKKSKLCVIL